MNVVHLRLITTAQRRMSTIGNYNSLSPALITSLGRLFVIGRVNGYVRKGARADTQALTLLVFFMPESNSCRIKPMIRAGLPRINSDNSATIGFSVARPAVHSCAEVQGIKRRYQPRHSSSNAAVTVSLFVRCPPTF